MTPLKAPTAEEETRLRAIESKPLTKRERNALLKMYRDSPIHFYHVPDAVRYNDNTSRWEATVAELESQLLAARREVERMQSALREIARCADRVVDSPSAEGCDYRIALRQIAARAATPEEKNG